MAFDIDMIKSYYEGLGARTTQAKKVLKRPMTLAENILYEHLHSESVLQNERRTKKKKITSSLDQIEWPCKMQQHKWLYSSL